MMAAKDDVLDHGAFPLGKVRPDGSIVTLDETMAAGQRRARVLDSIDQWRERGDIEPRLHEAANRFRFDYYDARRIPRFVAAMQERVDKSHTASLPVSDREIAAGKKIHHAMMSMPIKLWDAVVAIVAEGKSVKVFAAETGRDRKVVKGFVIAGLECLAKAYRL